MRIAVSSRRHRFDDITSIEWMVVAVVADEAPVFVIRREKTGSLVANRLEHETAVVIALDAIRCKELLLAVHLETAGMFFLIGDVRRRSSRNHHGARRQLDQAIFQFEANGLKIIA